MSILFIIVILTLFVSASCSLFEAVLYSTRIGTLEAAKGKETKRQLAAEMSLRGFADKTPVLKRGGSGLWPQTYIDEPFRQFQLLRSKYEDKEQGRIPLPQNAQQLWSNHKYSVLARDTLTYEEIGRRVSGNNSSSGFERLALQLVELLRTPPPAGSMSNALQHMWGYVSGQPGPGRGSPERWSSGRLLAEIQRRAKAENIRYLLCSTALSELKAWMPSA